MQPPRIFVSFSTRDRVFVRRLFARIGAQPLDLWDYSQESREIPGGADIAVYLRERIDQCRFFVPIVTANSLISPYTVIEVEHALSRRRRPAFDIIPLVDTDAPDARGWPPPYRELSGLRYYPITLDSRDSMEEAIQRLCADMQVGYVKPILDDPRLPFLRRLDEEIAEKSPRRDERDIGIGRRLEQIRNEIVHSIEEGDYERGARRAAFFCATCEYEYPEQRFYYPYLVQAVCLISCGDLNRALELLRDMMDHPRRDESLYGAMGYVRQQQGAHREALAHYREAMRLDPSDPAAQCGVLVNACLCNETTDVDQLLREVIPDDIPVPGDRAKVLEIKALALASLSRLNEARSLYEQLVENESVSADGLINFVLLLCRQQAFSTAYDLMARFAGRFADHAGFLHHRATLCFRMGRIDEATGSLDKLIVQHPSNRQYRIDLAQMKLCRDRRADIEDVVRPMLDRTHAPLPEDANDFYLDGFANYMCGHHERSRYDFERSGFDNEYYYDRILARLGIADQQ